MTLGRTDKNKIKIKAEGGGLRAVNCACCESPFPPCPEITEYYIVISEAMFNALRAGGSVSASGGGSEYTGCSFSATATGTLGDGNCGGSAGVYSDNCTDDSGQQFQSYMAFTWSVSKVGLEYRLAYGQGGLLGLNSGKCFANINIMPPTLPPMYFCYTVGFITSWEADTNGGSGFITNVGTTTLTTSAGSLTFGIWNLDNTATAFLIINIT